MPNNLIAWFWSDMDLTDADVTRRHVYMQLTTVNGRSVFVIIFKRLPEYSADAGGWITGQLILLAGADASTNDAIKLQYEEHGTSIDLKTATVDGDAVELVWRTVTETGNDGFCVERRVPGKGYDDIRFVEGGWHND